MRSNRFKKSLSVFLSLLMLLTTLAVGVVPFSATAALDTSTLIGRYFSTDNVWYDAARGANGIQWQAGDYPAYNGNLGMTYFNGMYVRIDNNSLFQNVTRDTGVTFAFNYRPNFTGDHRHILSLGQNAYGNGTENQFFISGATSWYSSGRFPVVAWMNGGSETIKAYPADVSPVLGHDYNIVVVVDKDAGVVFYIDGEKKNTVYVDSDLNGQLGNIRGFLDAVHNYGENYIGCSRWTADAKIEGYLSDVRIYKTAATETEAYGLVADMAGSSFNLAQPSFNATAYHYSDPANGAYANLAYSSPATNEDSGMGIRGADNSDDYKDIEAVYFKFFTPLNVVMVYDGAHETYASIELETKRHNKTNVQDQRIYYVISNSSLLQTRHNWYGYLDSAWKTWAGAYTANQINTDPNLDVYVGSTNDTPRFWWNAIKYTGTGNNDTYYDHEQNISFTLQAFFDYTVGGTSKGNGTITTLSNYYVLNYKPVYDVLNAAAAKYNNEMADKAWMYTEASYAKAMLAMRRLALCNPNLYDYGTRGVDAAAVMCAAAIKQAKADYDAINLVKKTATVHINAGTGTDITVTNNGTPVSDGATVTYGDTLSVSAAAQAAYNQSAPAITITGGTVSGNSALVNEPDIYISTADLPLNRYSLTVDEGEGTAISYSVSEAADANGKYPHGAVVTASASALTGYDQSAAELSVTGGSTQSVSGGVCTVSMTGDVTLSTADLAKNKYQVTVTPGTGAVISGAATGKYEYGTELTVTAAADTGYTQSTPVLSVNGETVTGTSHTFTVTGPVTVSTNNLSLNTYTVTFSYGDDQTSTVTKTHGATLTTADIPTDTAKSSSQSTDYTFTGWDGDTAAPITDDVTFTAQYGESARKYTVTVTPGEGVVITGVSTGEYEYGTELTVTAAADTGYTQSTPVLSVNGETVTGTSHTFTVTGPVTVSTNNLSLNTYTVTFSYGDDQTSTVTKTHGATLTTADIPTDTAKSSSQSTDYTFTGWDGDTAAPITDDVTFTAQYGESARKYTVTVTPGEGVVITGVSTGEYEYGTELTVTAAAEAGYNAENLQLRANGAAVSNPYSFTLTGDITLTADDLTPDVYYTVTFYNYDTEELYTTTVPSGGTAVYEGDMPAKPNDPDGHAYAFLGWDNPLEDITEDTDFTAQFEKVHIYNKYVSNETHHARMCSVPGCETLDSGSYEIHDFRVQSTTPGTCMQPGSEVQVCSVCEYSKTVTTATDPNNHENIADVPAVSGTCVSEGYSAGTKCTACNEFILEPVAQGYDYSEAGHTYGNWISNGDGTHTKTCTLCAEETENHSVNGTCAVGENGVAANCVDKAVCGVCGGEFGNTDLLNHKTALAYFEQNDPTCEMPGNNAYYFCAACSNYYLDSAGTEPADILEDIVIPASGHTWSVNWIWNEAVTPPTAQAAFVCGRDPGHNRTVNATVEEIASSAALCGEPGSVTYRASYTMQGVTYTTEGGNDKTVATASLPHLWVVDSVEWSADHGTATINLICERDPLHVHQISGVPASEVTVSAADCVNDKVIRYTASAEYDGYSFTVETEEITVPDTAMGHLYGDPVSNGNNTHTKTCTREGCTAGTADHAVTNSCYGGEATCSAFAVCEGCNTAYGEKDDDNHKNVVDAQAVPETCCTVGYTAGTVCMDCGKYLTGHVEIPADPVNGHLYPEAWTPANGTHTKTCTREGCTDAVANHTISEACSGGTATCIARKTCDICQGEYGETAPDNHVNTRDVDPVDANCVTEGFSAGVYCDDCRQFISGHDSLGYDYSEETGHDYGEWITNGNGTHSKTCSRCEATVTNHTVTADCYGGTATCTEAAVCDICGTAYGTSLGHDFDEAIEGNVTVVDPTCTEAGLKTVKCSRCDETKETVIRALGHDWGEWTVVTQPQPGVPGQDQRVCSRCGETQYRTTTLSNDADKFIKFTTVKKMQYVLDVGNGFVFNSSNTFYWYSVKALSFRIEIDPNADYDAVIVYLNGGVLAPNADGSYTISAHAGNDTVTVEPLYPQTPSGNSGGSSGTCPYCGETHANNLWGRIISLIHTILAFFRNLFRR